MAPSPDPAYPALVRALTDAIEAAVRVLWAEHPDETFYVIALVTTGEALAPVLSAWSVEGLEAAVQADTGGEEGEGEAEDAEDLRELLRWSHADSPHYGFGEAHFQGVRALFEARPDPHALDEADYDAEVELRLDAMTEAMARVDADGLFGTGKVRDDVVVLVDVMPPDAGNTARALRLNPSPPRGATARWLAEAAEPEASGEEL